ncbi:hypothetical protein BGZ72_007054 [Mortierella alpina]|nr:hypothetical protein BGZ72_007054 [Mortierella alpina]
MTRFWHSMGDSRIHNKARRAGLLLGVVFSVFSATSLVQVTSGQGQQTQSLCSPEVCISATVYSKDPNTIEFSLSSKIAVGWLGLGMGGAQGNMAGNDLAICWPDAANSGAVISQRSASMNGLPLAKAGAVPFKVVPQKSGLSSANNQFRCTYSRPLNIATSPLTAAATSIDVIYAVGLQPVTADATGDPQKAVLRKHTFASSGLLTIVKKDGSSSDDVGTQPPPAGGNGTTGDGNDLKNILEAEKLYTNLLEAHGFMMAVVFLLLLPLGASIVRFFGHINSVFRWHRPIQVLGFLTAVAAFITIIVAFEKSPQQKTHVDSPHAKFGVVIVCMLVVQVCIGIFIFHTFDPSRDPAKGPTIPTWVHRFWGYAVLVCGLAQVAMGLDKYGEWPTGKEGVWIFYYIWVVILVVIFLGGSVFKKLRSNQQRKRNDGGGSYYNQENDPKRPSQGLGQQQQQQGDYRGREEDTYELQQHGQQVSGGVGYRQ